MKRYLYPDRADWDALLARPALDAGQLEGIVREVMDNVCKLGDSALKDYTARFDKVEIDDFRVTAQELAEAEALIDPPLKAAIQTARENIETFHRAQIERMAPVETQPGVVCWREARAIERVGLYIPGGTAPLFSTLLMLGVPAQVAGCDRIVLCTPAQKDGSVHPAIRYTAHLLGLTEVYKVGGAQAIAAMTFGTETIPKVDKLFGPGNQYVTEAKAQATRHGLAIDMPAGPSEVMVVADQMANPAFVAADLLSQAEHGADSQVILLTLHEELANAVDVELKIQLARLPRKEMATEALTHSKAIIARDEVELIELMNWYAAEHLILQVQHPEKWVDKVKHAGSVFLGAYTPESAGDYASGTNHTLPTAGYARAYSGVSWDSFVRKITFQQISKEGLDLLGPTIEAMAAAELLEAHRHASAIRRGLD